MEFLRPSSLLALVLLVVLCSFSDAQWRNSRSDHCNRRCMLFVNQIVRLRYRNSYDQYAIYSAADRRGKLFCPVMSISDDQCSKFVGYLLQNKEDGLTSLSVCKKFNVCGPKKASPKSKLNSCSICSTLKKNVVGALEKVTGQLFRIKTDVASTCQASKDPSVINKCNLVFSKMEMFDTKSLMGLAPGICEKFLCNTAAKSAVAFLPKSPGSCKLCQEIFGIVVDGFRQSSKFVGSVLKEVDSLCKSATCHASVAKTKQIIDKQIQRFEAANVCKMAKVCPGSSADQTAFSAMKRMFTSTDGKPGSCAVCEKIEEVASMQKLNFGVSNVKSYMNEACQAATDDKLKRTCAIANRFVKLANFNMSSFFGPALCRSLLCSRGMNWLAKTLPRNPQTCATCKSVVGIVDDGIKGMNGLALETLRQVDDLCNTLSQDFAKQKCHSAVKETIKIYKLVVSKFDTSNICGAMKLCSNETEAVAVAKISTSCPFCDKMSSSVTIGTTLYSAVISQVRARVSASCSNASSGKPAQCRAVLSKVENFKMNTSFGMDLCPKIFCSSMFKQFTRFMPRSEVGCKICLKSVLIATDSMNLTTVLVNNMLRDVANMCNSYKSETAKKECRQGMSDSRTIFNYVMKKVDLSNICKDLNMCTKAQEAKLVLDVNKAPKRCDTCDTVEKIMTVRVNKLKVSLGSLKMRVMGACNGNAKAGLAEKCSSVTSLMNSITALVSNHLKPEICRNFLCSRSASFLMRISRRSSCSMCKKTVGFVSSSIATSSKMVDSIMAEVDSLCSSLSSAIAQQKCNFAIKESKLAFQEIITMFAPGTICDELAMCPDGKAPGISSFFGAGGIKLDQKKIMNSLGKVLSGFTNMFQG